MSEARPVIILGAGGHAKVLIDVLTLRGAVILGLLDPDPQLAGAVLAGVPVLGGDQALEQYDPGRIVLVNGLGSVALPLGRKVLYEKSKAAGFRFLRVLHPSAIIAADVVLGEGVQVMAGAVIQPGSRIGANSIVNTRAAVDHDCSIGDHVHLAPGVTLSGGVTIGDLAHIGTGATVIQNTTIGSKALVAAGAVVVRDVAPGTTVRGIPAKEQV